MYGLDKVFLFLLLIMAAAVCHADVGLEDVVHNVLGPATTLVDIAYNICYILGAGLVVGSFVQFKAHRDNPSQVHLSQPIVLLLIGLAVAALPLIAQLSSASLTLTENTSAYYFGR